MFGMSLGLSMGLQMEQLQVRKIIITNEQELLIKDLFLAELRGEKYVPANNCPVCEYNLAPFEILSGFLDNVDDFTTVCPKCRHRFPASLKHYRYGSEATLPFLCSSQSLHQLESVDENLDPKEIKKIYPSLYHSLLYHFGTIRGAFAQIGIKYAHDEVKGWEKKIKAYLGKLPDYVIASFVGVSTYKIMRMRSKLGINIYQKPTTEQVWQKEAKPLLGTMPDIAVAQKVGISRRSVAKLRKNLGIKKFNKNNPPLSFDQAVEVINKWKENMTKKLSEQNRTLSLGNI